MRHVLKTTFCFLSVALLEFSFGRFYLHSILKARIGFVGLTDSDILFPGILTCFLLVFSLTLNQGAPLELQRKTLLLHGVLAVVTLFTTLFFVPLRAQFGTYFMVPWFGLWVATLGTSFFLFVAPSWWASYPNRFVLFPAFMLALSKLASTYLLKPITQPMQKISSLAAFGILKLFSSGVSFVEFHVGAKTFFQLRHPAHTLAIGTGCSGLDGIVLISLALLVTWSLDPRKVSRGSWFTIFLIGIFYMFGVNLLRLLLLFSTPVIYDHFWGEVPRMLPLLLGQWREFAGWVMYWGAVLVFYVWLLPFFLRMSSKANHSMKDGEALPTAEGPL